LLYANGCSGRGEMCRKTFFDLGSPSIREWLPIHDGCSTLCVNYERSLCVSPDRSWKSSTASGSRPACGWRLNRFSTPYFSLQYCAIYRVRCHSGCAISSTLRCCFRTTRSGATTFFVKMLMSGCAY
jgi:hypothetical protein